MPAALPQATEAPAHNLPYRLYVVGGLDSTFQPVSTAWRLNPAQGAWEELPSLSSARAGPIAVAAEGCLYVLGGEFCGDALGDAQRFDASAGKWESLAPMLEGRIKGAAVAAGGLVYVFGGQDGLKPVNTAECYDPRTNTWRALPPMHRQRYACAAAVTPEGHIVVFGGELTDQGCAASVELFDPKTEVWQLLPAVTTPPPGSNVAITATGDRAFTVGGLGLSGQALPVAERLPLGFALAAAGQGPDMAKRFAPPAWMSMSPMLMPRHLASVTGFGGGAVVVGGKGPTFEAVSAVEMYDADTNAWGPLPALPAARLRAGIVAGNI